MNEPTPTPPTEGETFQALLEFFKALADPNRLRIIGMLAHQPLSVEQMAEMLKLRASTVSHHLSYLVHVGLVSARPESYYNIYSFRRMRWRKWPGNCCGARLCQPSRRMSMWTPTTAKC